MLINFCSWLQTF